MSCLRRVWTLAAAAALAAGASGALADRGLVTHVAGTLSAKKPDGTIRVLSPRSEVRTGDTLTTERDSHGEIRFADGGRVTLAPNTSMTVKEFAFAKEKPKEDSFLFDLVKGGLRVLTGLVASRNRNKFVMGTATATIGIRGTTFTAHDCLTNPCGQLKPGVYFGVTNGVVLVSNPAGQLRLSAGQFSIVEKGQPPRLTPNPGLSITPPQAFSRPPAPGKTPTECIVR